jgi:hypothetical protein
MAKPGVTLRLPDREGLMPHTQSWVTARLVVGRRAAPVLDEEKREVLGRICEVLIRIQGPQQRVLLDPRVEARHQQPEGWLAAGCLVDVADHWHQINLATRRLDLRVMATGVTRRVGLTERIRTGYFMLLLLLVVEFLLGMAVNLFVIIPKNHPGANPPEYFSGVADSVTWAVLHGPFLLILHAGLGLLLILFSVNLLAQAIQSRRRRILLPAAFGALGVAAAGFNGGSFLNYNEDFSSMLMAAFFAIAIVSYVTGLYQLPRNPTASESP